MLEPTNPYEPSTQAPVPAQGKRKSALRFIPALLIGLLGMAATAMAFIAFTVSYRFVFVEHDMRHWPELLASCLFYPSIGLCWLLSSALIWQGAYRKGTIAGIIGLALTVMLFTLAGF